MRTFIVGHLLPRGPGGQHAPRSRLVDDAPSRLGRRSRARGPRGHVDTTAPVGQTRAVTSSPAGPTAAWWSRRLPRGRRTVALAGAGLALLAGAATGGLLSATQEPAAATATVRAPSRASPAAPRPVPRPARPPHRARRRHPRRHPPPRRPRPRDPPPSRGPSRAPTRRRARSRPARGRTAPAPTPTSLRRTTDVPSSSPRHRPPRATEATDASRRRR